MTNFDYKQLEFFHREITDTELNELQSKANDFFSMKGFTACDHPAKITEGKKKKGKKLLFDRYFALAKLLRIETIRKAESEADTAESYLVLEQSLFTLLDVVSFIESNPEKFQQYLDERHQAPDRPVTADTQLLALLYLGRCLEKLLLGESPKEAFNIQGNKGKPIPTPKNLKEQCSTFKFRYAVALLVHTVRKNNRLTAEESFLEAAELFNMEGKENTIKHWYNKHLTDNKVIIKSTLHKLQSKKSQRLFAQEALASYHSAQTSKS
ncbi:hypothetical protein [Endozoicomonas sp. 8E]|uniref:hypothetical protein n=1 Tax=Endozoicomonas sp. 8E TaxID=3035692 RepID=UPI002938FD13|nr:hypothetical protein [Endozoicomonas sp. 8E]WOG27875.1 hypothetical protein P6910_25570 [Endozoicomonas sp. 8E]